MSKKATLTWADPPAPFTAIELAIRVQGAPAFSVAGTVGPGVQSFPISGLADGDYDFRAVAVNGSARSSGQVVSASVVTAPPVDATPADVTGFSVSVGDE